MTIPYIPPLDPNFGGEGQGVRFNGTEWELYDNSPIPELTPKQVIEKNLYQCVGMRNSLLAKSDFIFLADSQIDKATIPAWEAYRQALRDLPNTDANWGDPEKVVFPIEPEYKKA
jgi:hypothetical protein